MYLSAWVCAFSVIVILLVILIDYDHEYDYDYEPEPETFYQRAFKVGLYALRKEDPLGRGAF